MIRKVMLAIAVISCMLAANNHYMNPSCPEDGCVLVYHSTLFCQGIMCKTVKVYRCGCCGKYWKVYE